MNTKGQITILGEGYTPHTIAVGEDATSHQSDIFYRIMSELRVQPKVARYRNADAQRSRLAVFDLDGTLVMDELMLRMAPHIPDGQWLKKLTIEAINGTDDWEDNYQQRVQLYEGISVELLNEEVRKVTITRGAKELVECLYNQFGVMSAIVTGAWQGYADAVAKQLGIQYVFGSEWGISTGHFTGEIVGSALSPARKVEVVETLAQDLDCTMLEVTTIGDGYNDIPMLSSSGQSFIYHANAKGQLPITCLIDWFE